MTRKIAMVTGAGRGIGKGIAIQLAKAGYDLAIHYSTTAEGAIDTIEKVRALGARAENRFHGKIALAPRLAENPL